MSEKITTAVGKKKKSQHIEVHSSVLHSFAKKWQNLSFQNDLGT